MIAELNRRSVLLAGQALTALAVLRSDEYGPRYTAMLTKMAGYQYMGDRIPVDRLNVANIEHLRLAFLLESLSCINYTPEEREFIEACVAWMSL